MSEIIHFHCPQCGARHAAEQGTEPRPFLASVTCVKCHIPMVASPPSMDDCKYRHEDHSSPPVAYCARGVNQSHCRYCKSDHSEIERLKEVSQMKEQWEEIQIEDVQPGDVARCNGREFPVMPTGEDSRRKWYVNLGSYQMADYDTITVKTLGITFHRKVKREPRGGEAIASMGYDGQYLFLGNDIPPGTYIRWEELLDGEDGA